MPIRYLSGVNVDSNTLVVDAANDRVGIGTASPGAQLHLQSSSPEILLYNTTTAGGTLNFVDQAWQSQIVGIQGNLLFKTGGTTERVRITNDGNVGIGTTAPATKLHIHGYTTIDGVDVVAAFSSDNTAKRVNIGYSTSGDYGFINAVHTGVAWKNLIFGVNGGNVGIGTTAPVDKLQIGDYTGSNSLSITSADGANYAELKLREFNNNYGVTFKLDSNLDILNILYHNNSSSGQSAMAISRVSGNVGIGTTSPISKLTVLAASTGYSSDSQIKISDGSTSYYGGLSFDDSGATRLSIRNSYDGTGSVIGFGFGSSSDKVQIIDGTGLIVNEGNVGIGTTSPGSKLVSQISAPGYSIVGQHSSGGQVGFYNSTADNGVGTVNNYALNLFTNNSAPQVTLTTAGNVGIGTTSPAYKLDVSGTGRFTAALAADSNIDLTGDLRYQSNAGFGLKSQNGTRLFEVYNTGISFVTALGGTSATFSSSVTASSLIKSGGTASQYLMADGSVSTLTNPVTGTGTTNYVPKFTASGTIGNSAITDNGTALAFGLASSINS